MKKVTILARCQACGVRWARWLHEDRLLCRTCVEEDG